MQTLADAAWDAVPIVVGYVTLGLAAGMLLVAEGLSWWWAPVWSLVIYSGTMQMLLVPLAGGGEPLAAIALSTGFVSGRHVFYGLGFPLERVRGRALTRLYAVHAITDEVYALLAARDRRAMSGRYLVGVEAISHAAWVSGTTVGALAGTALASAVGERPGHRELAQSPRHRGAVRGAGGRRSRPGDRWFGGTADRAGDPRRRPGGAVRLARPPARGERAGVGAEG